MKSTQQPTGSKSSRKTRRKTPLETAQTLDASSPTPETDVLAEEPAVDDTSRLTPHPEMLDTKEPAMLNLLNHPGQIQVSESLLRKLSLSTDLTGLSDSERTEYYNAMCQISGLSPLTQPFGYIEVKKRTILYARKSATDQLRRLNEISVIDVETRTEDHLFWVKVTMQTPDNRTDCDVGCSVLPPVPKNATPEVAQATLEAQANARMRAMTKAKRRCTLSICGLTMLDESEMDTVAISPRELMAQIKQAREAANLEKTEIEAEIKRQFPTVKHPSKLAPWQVMELLDWIRVEGERRQQTPQAPNPKSSEAEPEQHTNDE